MPLVFLRSLCSDREVRSWNHWVVWQVPPAVWIHLVIEVIVRILRIAVLRVVVHLVHGILALTAAKLDREHIPWLHLAVNVLLLVDEWIHGLRSRLLDQLNSVGRHGSLGRGAATHLSDLGWQAGRCIEDLPLDSARTDLLDLLHLRHLVELPPRPLHLPLLPALLDLLEQPTVGPVNLVLVNLVEVLGWIINSIVDWLEVGALGRLEAAIQRNSLLIIEAVKFKFRGFLARRQGLISGRRESHLHLLVQVRRLVVHRQRVVEV